MATPLVQQLTDSLWSRSIHLLAVAIATHERLLFHDEHLADFSELPLNAQLDYQYRARAVLRSFVPEAVMVAQHRAGQRVSAEWDYYCGRPEARGWATLTPKERELYTRIGEKAALAYRQHLETGRADEDRGQTV